MSFWHELEKVKSRVGDALAVAKPVLATAEANLKPLAGVPGAVGTVAVVGEEGVAVLNLLVQEIEALLAAVPNADSVPPAPVTQ